MGQSMDEAELKTRTKRFGLRAISLVESLPAKGIAQIIGRQLVRSASSVGANYRAACRAKSVPDFISKIATVEEETDESIYWMELLVEAGIVHAQKLEPLIREGDELLAIMVASLKTAKAKTRTTGEMGSRQSRIENPKSKIQN